MDVPLAKGTNRFVFRTVNLFEVSGPEHRIQIDWVANAARRTDR